MQCYEFQVPVKLLSGHGSSARSTVTFSWHNLNETAFFPFFFFFGPTQGLNILMVMDLLLTGASFSPSDVCHILAGGIA